MTAYIARRAHRLGFCRWRGATALGASQRELALVGENISVAASRDHQELIDVGQLINALHGPSGGAGPP